MKMWIKSICFVFVVTVVMAFANQAKATLLPWLDFGSNFTWDGTSLYTDNASSFEYVQNVTYNDLSSGVPGDPVFFSEVTMSLSFDGDDTNDTLTVVGWFDADIIIINPSFDPVNMTPNPYVAMLDNIDYFGPGGSQWWDEFSETIGGDPDYDGQLSLSFLGSTDNGDGTFLVNGNGKVTPVPEPGTIALLGIGLAGLVGVGVRRKMKKNVD